MMWSCAYTLSCARLNSFPMPIRTYVRTWKRAADRKSNVSAARILPLANHLGYLNHIRVIIGASTRVKPGGNDRWWHRLGKRFCRRISVSVPTTRADRFAVTGKHFRYIDHGFFHPPAPAPSHTVATYPSPYVYM